MLVLASIVALTLALAILFFKDMHEKAEALSTKKDILSAVLTPAKAKGLTEEQVNKIFAEQVELIVLNAKGEDVTATANIKADKISMRTEKKKSESERLYPLFVYYNTPDEMKTKQSPKYILSMIGRGLWDEIWGWLTVDKDCNTVVGVSLDHKAETPGLGAEIKDNPKYFEQYYKAEEGRVKKQIFDADGNFASIANIKGGGSKTNPHGVDAVSGATITSVGVSDMISTGLTPYVPYLKAQMKK